MSSTVTLTEENFQTVIDQSSDKPVFIDFWAAWCGPCRMFAPVFEKTAEEYPDAIFAKVDTDAEQRIAAAFNINSIPTLAAIRNNTVVFMQPGALPASSLKTVVDEVIKLDESQIGAGKPGI